MTFPLRQPRRAARVEPGGSATALLIHGAGGGGWEWRAWARVLGSRGFDVHAPDLVPGADGLADTGFEDYVEQVVRYGRALERPLLLAGASLGGLLALAAGELEPAGRVLVNPVPPAGTQDWPMSSRSWPAVIPWGDEPDFEATALAMPDCGHAARVLAHQRWRNESGRVMTTACEGVEVPRDAVPTLVLGAQHDPDVPAEVSRALAGHNEWDFVLIPGASHLGPLLGDSAAACARLACDWFGRVSFSFDSVVGP